MAKSKKRIEWLDDPMAPGFEVLAPEELETAAVFPGIIDFWGGRDNNNLIYDRVTDRVYTVGRIDYDSARDIVEETLAEFGPEEL